MGGSVWRRLGMWPFAALAALGLWGMAAPALWPAVDHALWLGCSAAGAMLALSLAAWAAHGASRGRWMSTGRRPVLSTFLSVLFTGLCVLPTACMGILYPANAALDRSVEQPVRATVEDTGWSGWRRWIAVPLAPGAEASEIYVPFFTPLWLDRGDVVEVVTRPGALGVRWVAGVHRVDP